MCHRQEIFATHDLITKLPDEMLLSREQVHAILTVLFLLSSLLERSSRPTTYDAPPGWKAPKAAAAAKGQKNRAVVVKKPRNPKVPKKR